MLKMLIIVAVLGVGGKIMWDRTSKAQAAKKEEAAQYAAGKTSRDVEKMVQNINESMPQSYGGGKMRLEKVVYANNVLRYSGTILVKVDLSNISDDMKWDIQKEMKGMYCGSEMRKANIEVEYAWSAPPTSLSDLRTQTFVTSVKPESCGAA